MSEHWSLLLLPGLGWPAAAVWMSVPLLALAIDWWLGEPPARWHPVVWMGTALHWGGERVAPLTPVAQDFRRFWLGGLVWIALAAIVLIVSWWLQHLALTLMGWLALGMLAALDTHQGPGPYGKACLL